MVFSRFLVLKLTEKLCKHGNRLFFDQFEPKKRKGGGGSSLFKDHYQNSDLGDSHCQTSNIVFKNKSSSKELRARISLSREYDCRERIHPWEKKNQPRSLRELEIIQGVYCMYFQNLFTFFLLLVSLYSLNIQVVVMVIKLMKSFHSDAIMS